MVAILVLLIGLLLCSPSLAGGDIVYPIQAMSGYYGCTDGKWYMADVTLSTAFRGNFKWVDPCSTWICDTMNVGQPSYGIEVEASLVGENYVVKRGVVLFETIDVDTSKSVRLCLNMLQTAIPTDGDTFFIVPCTLKCTSPCEENVEACVTDSCNFYRCQSLVWSEDAIAYLEVPAEKPTTVCFQIPKDYINYGDTTAFMFVSRRVDNTTAPTGENFYATRGVADTLGYLLFHEDNLGTGKYGLQNWGVSRCANYGKERKRW